MTHIDACSSLIWICPPAHVWLAHLHPYSWAVKRHLHLQHFKQLHVSTDKPSVPFDLQLSNLSPCLNERVSLWNPPPPRIKETEKYSREKGECGRTYESLSSLELVCVCAVELRIYANVQTSEEGYMDEELEREVQERRGNYDNNVITFLTLLLFLFSHFDNIPYGMIV